MAGLGVLVPVASLTPVSSWPSCFPSLGFGFPIYKMVVGRMTSMISLTAWNPVPTLLKTSLRCSPPCNSPGTVAWQMGSKASAGHPQVQPSPLSCQHFFCLSGGWCGCQCCNQMPPLPLPSYPAQLSHSLGGLAGSLNIWPNLSSNLLPCYPSPASAGTLHSVRSLSTNPLKPVSSSLTILLRQHLLSSKVGT